MSLVLTQEISSVLEHQCIYTKHAQAETKERDGGGRWGGGGEGGGGRCRLYEVI